MSEPFIEAQKPGIWEIILETLGLRPEVKLDLGLATGKIKPGAAEVLDTSYAKPTRYKLPAPGSKELRDMANRVAAKKKTYVSPTWEETLPDGEVIRGGGRVHQIIPAEARAEAANLATQERYGNLPPPDLGEQQKFFETHMVESIIDPTKQARARKYLEDPYRPRLDVSDKLGEGIWKRR